MSALRILLAHHYHRIDPNQVWAIARVPVPDLVITLRSKSS
ncbi:HepT-like ribonuclease domain-containing protein [Ferrimicrobium sp.]